MKRFRANAQAEAKNKANALKQEEKNRREKAFEEKKSDTSKKMSKKD
jgi:hypothetical protein